MSVPSALQSFETLEDYLIWEERQELRYEYEHGRLRLMAGGTERHDIVRGTIYVSLFGQLRGKPCRPHLDLKLVCGNKNARYPDVSVVCSSVIATSSRLRDPKVVVEVVSPSTRTVDFLMKPIDYASVASIETYLIFDPAEPRVTILRRDGDALTFAEEVVDRDATIELPEIGATLALAEIYEAVPAEAEVSTGGS